MKYKINSYEDTERAVMEYQNNIPNASDKLVELFMPYLTKFSRIIIEGRVDLESISTRTFIGMFLKSPSRKYINMPKKSFTSVVYITDAVRYMKEKFAQRYEREEINNILVVCLLTIAKRYKQIDINKPMFHTYLIRSFPYDLYNLLIKSISDTTDRVEDPLIYDRVYDNYLETSKYDEYNLSTYNPNLNKLRKNYTNECIIDDDWVLGINVDIFDFCSVFERQLLKYKYIDKINDDDLVDIMFMAKKTIYYRKKALHDNLKYVFINKRMVRE